VCLAAVVVPVATVGVVGGRVREAVELAPPHPPTSTAIAAPNAATPRMSGDQSASWIWKALIRRGSRGSNREKPRQDARLLKLSFLVAAS
jgi:hypothetical protein